MIIDALYAILILELWLLLWYMIPNSGNQNSKYQEPCSILNWTTWYFPDTITVPDIFLFVFPFLKPLFLRAFENNFFGTLLNLWSCRFWMMLPPETCSAVHILMVYFLDSLSPSLVCVQVCVVENLFTGLITKTIHIQVIFSLDFHRIESTY